MARMMSAESEGPSKVSLQSRIHQFHEVTLTQDISQTSVSSSAHPVDAVTRYGISGKFGVLEHLDLGRDSSAILEAGLLVGYRVSSHAVFTVGSSIFWQTVQGKQTLGSSSTPLPFSDHARYTEIHGSGSFKLIKKKMRPSC